MNRFTDWEYPEIEEGKPTKYNWVVQNKDRLNSGARPISERLPILMPEMA